MQDTIFCNNATYGFTRTEEATPSTTPAKVEKCRNYYPLLYPTHQKPFDEYGYERSLFEADTLHKQRAIEAEKVKHDLGQGFTPHEITPFVDTEGIEKDLPFKKTPFGEVPPITFAEGQQYKVHKPKYQYTSLESSWWVYLMNKDHLLKYVEETRHFPTLKAYNFKDYFGKYHIYPATLHFYELEKKYKQYESNDYFNNELLSILNELSRAYDKGYYPAYGYHPPLKNPIKTIKIDGKEVLVLNAQKLSESEADELDKFCIDHVRPWLSLELYRKWLISRIRKAIFIYSRCLNGFDPYKDLQPPLQLLKSPAHALNGYIFTDSDIESLISEALSKEYAPRKKCVVFNPDIYTHPFEKLQIEYSQMGKLNRQLIKEAFDNGITSARGIAEATELGTTTVYKKADSLGLKLTNKRDKQKQDTHAKIQQWKQENRKGKQKQCALDLGLGIATVKRHWKSVT